MAGKQVSNSTNATQLAQALMLEQVQYIKNQLIHNNHFYTHQFIHQIYSQADQIQLNQVIVLEQLNAVVAKYAFELNLGPELLEFIGFVAQKVHHFIVHSDSTVNELLSDQSFELWMNKILELEQVRLYIQNNLITNPKAQDISLQLANQILETNTPWLDQLRKYNLNSSTLRSKVLSFIQDQQQTIELKLEKQLAQVILKQLGLIISLPSDELAEISTEIWSEIKTKSLKESFSQIQAIDVEDLFILVYETWKELRDTSNIRALILNIVEAFYDYFGEYSLQALLLAVGIDESDLFEEADRFIPSTLQALDSKKLLDPMIHSLIAPFYAESTTLKLIDDHLNNTLG